MHTRLTLIVLEVQSEKEREKKKARGLDSDLMLFFSSRFYYRRGNRLEISRIRFNTLIVSHPNAIQECRQGLHARLSGRNGVEIHRRTVIFTPRFLSSKIFMIE